MVPSADPARLDDALRHHQAMNLPTPEELLGGIPMFTGLPVAAIQNLAAEVRTVSFPTKALICRKGDSGDSMFIVKSGEVAITMPAGEDRETLLATLPPGEFFGELALLDGEPRSATARAAVDSELLVLDREPFFRIIREPNVIENLVAVLTARVRAANQIVAEKGIDNRKLEEETLTDPMTGLGNRRKLRRDLEVLEAQAHRYGYVYAVAMCDIDNFKRYNDTYGHAMGDDVLKAVAQAMARQCRSGDEVYRYGGEEFTVLLPAKAEDTAADTAALGMERIRSAVEQLQIEHTGNVPWGVVTFSSGVALLSSSTTVSGKEVLERADTALYEAKHNGRNRVEQHQPQPEGASPES